MASLAVVRNEDNVQDKDNGIMKINWTIHGGGSDGYYYNEGELDLKKEMHEDFVKVKDLFDYINSFLPEGKKIKSLKIFRWTSPGASIVSNEEVDDVFREIFEHPYWPQLYQSAPWKTRSGLGKKSKHLSETVGSMEGDLRGPGELMKDLQLFMYDEDNRQEASDVFLNELLSTEFINKYTQATSSDFGIWTLHDTGDYEKSYPEFVKRVKTNSTSVKQQKTEAQKLHEDIFKTNVGVGGTPSIKMTEVIKNIIVKLAQGFSGEKFPQHWEFYPVTCSPMMGVEGRSTLIEKRQFDEYRYKPYDSVFRITGPAPKPPQLIRLHTNAGLTFAYMLNIAKRCKVFNDGKIRRREWVDKFNLDNQEKKWKSVIDKLDPHRLQFENTFDCMDPDERRQLYIDINSFLQNVRPNQTRQQTNVFNAMTIEAPTMGPINLFDNAQFDDFIKKLEGRVKFDARKSSSTGNSLVTKIEANSLAYINEIIEEVDTVLLKRGVAEKKEAQEVENEYKKLIASKPPKILKLLFYVIYQASHHEDGIAKDYGLDINYTFQGSTSRSATNYSMGSSNWGLNEEYNFGDAVNKWVKSFWAGWSWRPKKLRGVGNQKMAKGVSDQLVSALLYKGPLPSPEERPAYDDWQDKAYEYLQYADGFVRKLHEKVKHDIIFFATDGDIKGATEGLAKEQLKNKVLAFIPKKEQKDHAYNFEEFYKSAIASKTIVFDADSKKFIKPKNGGRKRKKRTRRKRKFKFKWSRKRKKQNKKKIIRIKKIRNKTTRSYIKVKKRRKKTRGTR